MSSTGPATTATTGAAALCGPPAGLPTLALSCLFSYSPLVSPLSSLLLLLLLLSHSSLFLVLLFSFFSFSMSSLFPPFSSFFTFSFALLRRKALLSERVTFGHRREQWGSSGLSSVNGVLRLTVSDSVGGRVSRGGSPPSVAGLSAGYSRHGFPMVLQTALSSKAPLLRRRAPRKRPLGSSMTGSSSGGA